MNSDCNILIPDGSSTWAMSVVNCLSHINNYKLFILSDKKRTATKFSRYTSYYRYYKRTTDEAWIQILNTEIEANKISVIVPIAEEEIRFFIKYADKISTSAKLIPLPKANSFETAIDKLKLSEFLKQQQLPHPKSGFFDSTQSSFEEQLQAFELPILVKPLHDKGGDGILKFASEKKFKRYLRHKTLFVQEYISGYDIDCSVLCLNGEVLTYTIQKGNLLGHSPYAPQLGLEFLQNEAVINVVKQLMAKLNWSGIAHIDLRYDQQANNYKVIEINARFWGSVEASKVAGTNFPQLVIEMALGKSVSYQPYAHIKYLRFKGFLKSVKRQPSLLMNINFILNFTEAKSVLKDPLPTMYKFREWLGRASYFKAFNIILMSQELFNIGFV